MRDDREIHGDETRDPETPRAPVAPDGIESASAPSFVPSHPLKRRALIKTIAATAIALPMTGALAACTPSSDSRKLPVVDGKGASASGAAGKGPRGTLSDPDLLNPRISWEMQLTTAELTTLAALCDMIIPADEKSPSASQVGVPAYINEYVSAPPERYKRALVQVRGGLVWINVESAKRFAGKRFEALTNDQKTSICDDICFTKTAKPEFQQAAQFFDRVRDITAEAFYTTDEGMKDIGYVGNVALTSFDGPPPEVLQHLGLA